MKKRRLKSLMLGLATSILASSSGCSAKEVNIPDTASIVSEDVHSFYNDFKDYSQFITKYDGQEYQEAHDPSEKYITNQYDGISYENGLTVEDLYFIRLDGQIYLATKLTDINENNIISKYYALDTGQFLGQTLDINWYARSINSIDTDTIFQESDKIYEAAIDNDVQDKKYFNGEYGLGKNLCKENIICADSLFLKETILSKNQIDYFLENPLYTATLVEKYCYPIQISYPKEDYTFLKVKYTNTFNKLLGCTIAFNGESSSYSKKLSQFILEDKEEKTSTVFGYRASINPKDAGFNYIYDIESATYLNLDQYYVLKEKSTSLLPNTIAKTRKELKKGYPLNTLKAIAVLYPDNGKIEEKYYIAKQDEWIEGREYKYIVLGDDEPLELSSTWNGDSIKFLNQSSSDYNFSHEYNGKIVSLYDCLTDNDLSKYIKDVYTDEELALLLPKLRNKKLDLAVFLHDPITDQKDISINDTIINQKDIVVIDTSKESEDIVHVPSKRRFYLLLPREVEQKMDGYSYYELLDNQGICLIGIDEYFKSVIIVNSSGVVYQVCKPVKYESELKCVISLEDALREFGLEDYMQEEYTLADLENLNQAFTINENQDTLKRTLD